jgi:hypothetical protein
MGGDQTQPRHLLEAGLVRASSLKIISIMTKKIQYILVLFLIGLVFLYHEDILPQKKVGVYLLFDEKSDKTLIDI